MDSTPLDQFSTNFSGRVATTTLISRAVIQNSAVEVCGGITFLESCLAPGQPSLTIQVPSGYNFVSTVSPNGMSTWSQCNDVGDITLGALSPGDQITVSGICRPPVIKMGDGSMPWELSSCGDDALSSDTSIYFFYDRTSIGETEAYNAAHSAISWVNGLSNFNGTVHHIQVWGSRWVQWAEVPKTGMIGGLFGDMSVTTASINNQTVNVGNVVSFTGTGTVANPYVFNLPQSFLNYPTNDYGKIWTEAQILSYQPPTQTMSPGVIYPALQSQSKNVLVIDITNKAHAEARLKGGTNQIGWADYHSAGPGSNLTPANLGTVTAANWGRNDEAFGWPNLVFNPLSNNINTVFGSLSNSALVYSKNAATYNNASPEYVNKLKYFEAWKQAAFYAGGTNPYDGKVRPTKMENERQFNNYPEPTASWERDYRRFKMIFNNFKQGPTNSSYLEDVADGYRVSFFVYAGKPAAIGNTHIPFPLHAVGAIIDDAIYLDNTGTSVQTSGGLIEDTNLPYSGLWDTLTAGVLTTLLPLSYVGSGSASNGQNPYFDLNLGRLSTMGWGYNIDQTVTALDATLWRSKFRDDMTALVSSGVTCDSTDCLRIIVIDETTGAPIPNFQVSIPGFSTGVLPMTNQNGEVWITGLPAQEFQILGCYPITSSGTCAQWSMQLRVSSETHTISSACTLGCIDSEACNFDPSAGISDNSCVYRDCNEDCGGSAFYDECGICVGGNTGLLPGEVLDACGVCGGQDLNLDICGNCYGDGSSCSGCTDPTASNYNPNAIIDDGTCECTIPYYECILKEMAKKIVKDCSSDCYGQDCESDNSFLYEDFRTLESLLTQLKAYNRGICSTSAVTIIKEALSALAILKDDWECGSCKNC